MNTLPLEPIYGWGWFKASGSLFVVPPPFDLLLLERDEEWPPGAAIGQAIDAGHPLAGFCIRIVGRHPENPDYQAYNVGVFDIRPDHLDPGMDSSIAAITGFAQWGELRW